MKITYSIKIHVSMKFRFASHKRPSCGTKVLHSRHGQLGGTNFWIFTLKRDSGGVLQINWDHTPNFLANRPKCLKTIFHCIRIMMVIETCS